MRCGVSGSRGGEVVVELAEGKVERGDSGDEGGLVEVEEERKSGRAVARLPMRGPELHIP